MPRVEQTSRARLDVAEIGEYVAKDNPAAAMRLLERFDQKFEMLARQPLMGEMRDEISPGIRQLTVGSYVILYRPLSDGVRIVRVVHGARDFESLF